MKQKSDSASLTTNSPRSGCHGRKLATLAGIRNAVSLAHSLNSHQIEVTMYYTIYSSPLGPLAMAASGKGITMADFQNGARPLIIGKDWIRQTEPFIKATRLLDAYFAGQPVQFDLQYDLQGTPFQQQVWKQLLGISPGETMSYGEFAASLGRPSAARAVGTAIGRNPVSLMIPCHRVIGTNGSLTGYAGGLLLKQQLLDIEKGL